MSYKGAKYTGAMTVRAPKLGLVINPGDVVAIPEEEAKARADFEPVYDNDKKEPQRHKAEKEENN